MHIRSLTLSLILALAAAVNAPAYESLEALNRDHTAKLVEALKTYMEAHPDAADIEQAEQQLVFGYMELDQADKALRIFQDKYDALEIDADLDLETAVGEIISPILFLSLRQGDKNAAEAFLADVKTRFADHPDFEFLTMALADMEGMLAKPTVGDVLEIDFTSTEGETIDLGKYEGRVVLVDFWASWCMPCVRTLPGLVDLYDAFKGEGFEILGISLDEDRDSFDAMIERMGMTWPQYFDGKGWENDIASRYGIQAIPATFLIGPKGDIVKIDPTEDEIRAFLAETLAAGEEAPATFPSP